MKRLYKLAFALLVLFSTAMCVEAQEYNLISQKAYSVADSMASNGNTLTFQKMLSFANSEELNGNKIADNKLIIGESNDGTYNYISNWTPNAFTISSSIIGKII